MDFGDGSTSYGPEPGPRLQRAPGSRTVTLTVSDGVRLRTASAGPGQPRPTQLPVRLARRTGGSTGRAPGVPGGIAQYREGGIKARPLRRERSGSYGADPTATDQLRDGVRERAGGLPGRLVTSSSPTGPTSCRETVSLTSNRHLGAEQSVGGADHPASGQRRALQNSGGVARPPSYSAGERRRGRRRRRKERPGPRRSASTADVQGRAAWSS
ncbi:MAG: hypothetical protein MZU79_06975 [Anaerotruncus sp.]|nr:hypothetical protein [Anaerotruncus sp.]